ncbi:MAG: T9SS type A sorting domain-containing protein [Saprospiraceae bacterium]|nr:T9SS type A sorting domain-containing protein [Saprospiraceae bacterium]
MALNRLKWMFIVLSYSSFPLLYGQRLAPEVVASSGDFKQNEAGLSLSWTLGELVTATLQQDALILTQGFQQPDLAGTSSRFNWKGQEISIRLFPNPTSNRIFLAPDGDQAFGYRLTSMDGRVFTELAPKPGIQEIDLTAQPNGLFLVQIWKDQELLGNIKFIKSR